MTPEQTVLVEGPESLASLCLHLRRMSDSQGDQIDADRLSHCADLIEAQAAELATLRAERDALANPQPWEDRPDDLTAAVTASHPVHSGDYDNYVKALELVSNRHSKGALVALVCHLLREATPPAAVVEAMERALRAADGYLERGLDKMARNITRKALADLAAWRAGK